MRLASYLMFRPVGERPLNSSRDVYCLEWQRYEIRHVDRGEHSTLNQRNWVFQRFKEPFHEQRGYIGGHIETPANRRG